jgi:hypothetical protein
MGRVFIFCFYFQQFNNITQTSSILLFWQTNNTIVFTVNRQDSRLGSSSKIVSGSRALPPRWLPQCSCVVIESSFDPRNRNEMTDRNRKYCKFAESVILVKVLKCRTQFWKRTTQESFQQSLVEIGSVVSEEKIFKKFHPPFLMQIRHK